MNRGPSGREIARKPGILFLCDGCCCGEKNKKAAPFQTLVALFQSALEGCGLRRDVRVVRTGCLGPCSEANVLFAQLLGCGFWFGRIDQASEVEALVRFVAATLGQGSPAVMPEELRGHAFERLAGQAVKP